MFLKYEDWLNESLSQGYIGIEVNASKIKPWLKDLAEILGPAYDDFTQNQKTRDRGRYHVTLVGPPEYRKLIKAGIRFDNVILPEQDWQIMGIGRVEKGEDTAYYLVLNWESGQQFREQYGLDSRDFHITLGFESKDVHGVRKDSSTLVNKKGK